MKAKYEEFYREYRKLDNGLTARVAVVGFHHDNEANVVIIRLWCEFSGDDAPTLLSEKYRRFPILINARAALLREAIQAFDKYCDEVGGMQ